MIHSKATKPRIFPWNGTSLPAQMDRLQDLNADINLNRDKLYEIGRDGILVYHKKTPSFTLALNQFEYGSLAMWRYIANKDVPNSGDPHYITLEDVKSTYFDVSAYLTDDNGSFRGTLWFPRLRLNGMTLNIADPDAIVQRSWDIVGEDYTIINQNYLAYQDEIAVTSGSNDLVMTLSPVPLAYSATEYIFRVVRVRSGVCTELVEDVGGANDTWAYNSVNQHLTIKTCLAGDVVKAYFPTATAYTTLWTDNNISLKALFADSCTIEMKVGTSEKIYRLQSASFATAFTRTDYKEIGNAKVVQTGVKDKTVTITLGRLEEDFTLEEILSGDTVYPYINARDFIDTIQLRVLVYTDSTKTTFAIGYLMKNISPTAFGTTQTVEDYGQVKNTLECDNLKVSDLISEVAFL